MEVYDSLTEAMGNTPLLRLKSVTKGIARTGNVLAKIEYLNPGGSVKDRIALRMVETAERQGRLREGSVIVEPTSGNTGVGLAIVAAERGYKCVFVCPDKVAQDKISVLRAYGADVVVCPSTVSPDHPDSYYSVARRLAREEGLLVGGSSGLAVAAALRVSATAEPDAVIVVLLPDGGRGYLSKIFNDAWMADYGFLRDQAAGATVADLLAARQPGLPALVHVHPDETVAQAIALLREYDVSQLPVVQEEPPLMAAEVAGAVAERDLLDALVSGRASPQDPVSKHMSPPLPVLGQGEPVSRAAAVLEKAGAALVHLEGKPAAVLTRADLLGYYAAGGAL